MRDSLCIKKLTNEYGVEIKAFIGSRCGDATKDIPRGTDPFVDSYMGDQFFLIDKKKLTSLSPEIEQTLEDYYH